jgi:ERCC4-type nuclease
VDKRIGSNHLAPLLGPNAQLTMLDYGDCAFTGQGPTGEVAVGIELKRVADALACLSDGRFTSHQVPGLVQSYDRAYMIVEGLIRSGPEGILQIGYRYPSKESGRVEFWDGKNFGGYWADASSGRSRYTYRQFVNWLESISNMAGIKVIRTSCISETVQTILALESWWAKDWASHGSLHTFHEDRPDAALLIRPSLRRRIAAQLPGVGWQRSKDAASYFKTTRAMVMANPAEWARVEGIGKVTADKVVSAMESD